MNIRTSFANRKLARYITACLVVNAKDGGVDDVTISPFQTTMLITLPLKTDPITGETMCKEYVYMHMVENTNALLTHLAHEIDYRTAGADLPPGVAFACDGLTLRFEPDSPCAIVPPEMP